MCMCVYAEQDGINRRHSLYIRGSESSRPYSQHNRLRNQMQHVVTSTCPPPPPPPLVCLAYLLHASTGLVSVSPQPLSTGSPTASKNRSR